MKTDAKMNQKKYIAGIDIGTTKIVAIIGSENQYGKLEILGYGKAKSQGIARGMVGNIGKTIDSIQQAVAQAQAKAGVSISEAYVGIAGQHIHSDKASDYIIRENADEMITVKDLEALCLRVMSMKNMFPGEEVIHILPQEYKVDGQDDIHDPIGMVGSRLEGTFHIVTGQVAPIKNIHRCVTKAGVELKGLTLEPIASSASVLSEEEKEAGVALVDIGGGTTDLAIFKEGYIRYTAVVPFGGNIIDKDIKEGCGVFDKQAELLKIKFGSAWPEYTKENEVINIQVLKDREPLEIQVTNLARIIRCRMEEIIGAIFNEIKNYGYDQPRKKLIAGIVLTGGGSELKDLRQLVEYVTGLPTRIGLPNEHLASNTSTELESPIYATSIGLLLDAIERERSEGQRIDFSQIHGELTSNEAHTVLTPEMEQPKEETPIIPPTINNISEMEKEEKKEEEEESKSENKNFLRSISEKFTEFFKTME
ncbi:cell division protein FtsA [Capnocytophaga sp. oral taxon 338]|jgi:cell division protein FtsA|uniref:cell division protein FtsA n=2 Tax=unclassified Capnocytophaga TaxID=2640652 RepID=UPI000202C618|nr:cell division protein FtsA [Capnocytophaga sp. oral taxon 338]EGD33926.1 beta-hexosaminidase [Capnocytophaga sp. oral taxon 338 str. F0234]